MAAAGDPSLALEALVGRFGEMVHRLGARFGLSGADADELVQEVRIRLWTAQGTPERLGTVNASYVYRTATTAALVLIRRKRSGVPTESLGARAEAAVDPAAGAESALEEGELTRQLRRALGTLKAPRELAVRMHLAGHGLADIAALTRWSEAKVRNLVYRGMEDLRRTLARGGIGPEGS